MMSARARLFVVSLVVFAVAGCVDGASDDDDDGETGDSGESGDPDAGAVPGDPAYCAAVANWEPADAQLEQDVLTIVNQRRAEGANCGSMGNFGPASPLTMNGRLRCAARSHSSDMVARDYFSHNSPEGDGPAVRIAAAEYQWSTWGENIAGGSPDAAGTMQQWMDSDGHCANIMNPAFEEIGVGYVEGGQYGHTWTQVFGTP